MRRTPATSARRTPRGPSFLVRVLTLGWVLLMSLGCVLRHPPRFLVDALVHEAGQALELSELVVRDDVRIDLGSFALRLDGVAFRTADGRVSGDIGRIRVAGTPSWRSGPSFRLDDVSLSSPRLIIDIERRAEPDPSEDPWDLFDELPAFAVRDGQVRVFDGSTGLELSARRVEGEVDARSEWRSARLSAEVAPGSNQTNLGARLHAFAQATHDRVRLAWQVEHLNLDTATLRALPRALRKELEPFQATVEASTRGSLEFRRGAFPKVYADVDIERADLQLPEEIGARVVTRAGQLHLREGTCIAFIEAEVEGVPATVEAWVADVFDERTAVEIGIYSEEGSTGPWIQRILRAVDGPEAEVNAFRPEGRFGAALFLHRVIDAGGLRARARIEAQDLRARFEGFPHSPRVAFPLPMEHARGTLSIRRGQVLIPNVTAQRGDAQLDLSVAVAGIGDETIDIAIHMRDAIIEDALQRAGSRLDQFRDVWDAVRPESGRMDVDLRITRDPGRDDADVRGHVVARDWAVDPPIVGTRLWDVSGDVRIHPGEVDFDASGRGLDGTVSARTRLTFAPKAAGGGVALWDMRLAGRSHRLNRALREVLPKPLREALADIGFGGLVDFEMEWHEGPARRYEDQRGHALATLHPGPASWRASGNLFDVELGRVVTRLDGPPVPPESTASPSFEHLHAWLMGSFGQGHALATLELTDRPEHVDMALSLASRRSAGDEIRARLRELDQVPEETPDLEGDVDLDVELRGTTEGLEAITGTIDLQGIRVFREHEIASGLRGRVRLEPEGVATCDSLEGLIAGAHSDLQRVRARWNEKAVELSLDATLEGLQLQTFTALFGPDLRDKLATWRLDGVCDLEDGSLRLTIPRNDAEPEVELKASALVLHGVGFFPGVSFEDVAGQLRDVRGGIGQKGPYLEARLENASGRFLGFLADDIFGKIHVDEKEVKVDDLHGYSYRGTLTSGPGPFLTIRHTSDDPNVEEEFRIAFRFQNVQMREMLSSVKDEETYDEGRMSGVLSLRGRPDDLYALGSLLGEGHLEIQEGKFGSIPFLRTLNPFLGPKATDFHALKTRFRVRGCQVRIDDLELISDMVRLGGRGALGIDGSLAGILDITYLEIIPVPYLDEALGVGLGWIFENILNKVVHISISGTLGSPIITPGLTRPEDVDQGISPRPYVPGPIPPDLDRIPWRRR